MQIKAGLNLNAVNCLQTFVTYISRIYFDLLTGCWGSSVDVGGSIQRCSLRFVSVLFYQLLRGRLVKKTAANCTLLRQITTFVLCSQSPLNLHHFCLTRFQIEVWLELVGTPSIDILHRSDCAWLCCLLSQ